MDRTVRPLWEIGAACAVALGLALASPAAAIVEASSAADLCAPDEDPCVVAGLVRILPPGVLDFGMRTVELAPGARFLTDGGGLTIRCGGLRSQGLGVELRLAGRHGIAGALTIEARGRCSTDATTPCLRDFDCGAGTCSEGSGTVDLDARIDGRGLAGAPVLLMAAGDVRLAGRVQIEGRGEGALGGSLEVLSSGSVTLDAKVAANGKGVDSIGGRVFVLAGTDASIAGQVELRGGASGGFFGVSAGSSRQQIGGVRIAANVLCTAHTREGFGGDISVETEGRRGGDIELLQGRTAAPVELTTSAQSTAGSQLYYAEGAVRIGRGVRLEARARLPEGDAFGIELVAVGALTIDGSIVGVGYATDVTALTFDGDIRVSEMGRIEVQGSSVVFDAFAGGNLLLDGTVELVGGREFGEDPSCSLDSSRLLAIAGTLLLSDTKPATFVESLQLHACSIELLPTARVETRLPAGVIQLFAERRMSLRRGSSVLAHPQGGKVELLYEDAFAPPAVNGTVRPAPEIRRTSMHNPFCPVSPFQAPPAPAALFPAPAQ